MNRRLFPLTRIYYHRVVSSPFIFHHLPPTLHSRAFLSFFFLFSCIRETILDKVEKKEENLPDNMCQYFVVGNAEDCLLLMYVSQSSRK